MRDPRSAIESADDRLTAGLFDLGLGGLGELRGGDFQRACDFAVAENLDRFLAFADETVVREHLGRDLGDAGVEGREVAEIHHRHFGAEVILVETTVRQFAVQGHLTAFEAGTNAAAGAGRLAFAAATGGLAVAAAFAAADALFAVHRTFNVLEFVKFHGSSWEGAPHPAIRA